MSTEGEQMDSPYVYVGEVLNSLFLTALLSLSLLLFHTDSNSAHENVSGETYRERASPYPFFPFCFPFNFLYFTNSFIFLFPSVPFLSYFLYFKKTLMNLLSSIFSFFNSLLNLFLSFLLSFPPPLCSLLLFLTFT